MEKAEYTEIGVNRVPAIIYKKQGIFFKKTKVLNLLTDVKEIFVLQEEISHILTKSENIRKGMNIFRPFGLVGGLAGIAVGKLLPVNEDKVALACRLQNGDMLGVLVDKKLIDILSKRLELKIPPSTQYLRHLEGMDCMVNPSEFSHLCNRLINKNRLWHFRKQF